MNKKLIKIAAVVSKIIEVILWIVDGILVLALAASGLIGKGLAEGSVSISGLGMNIVSTDGNPHTAAVVLLLIGCILMISLCAMICRNIKRVFKSEKPFCTDNVRRVRDIGIFAISIPVIEVVFSVIVGAVSSNAVNMNINGAAIFFGFVVLCLSQYFKYGAALEEDVDGLV